MDPIYSSWWFWMLVAGIILLIIAAVVYLTLRYNGYTIGWYLWVLLFVGVSFLVVGLIALLFFGDGKSATTCNPPAPPIPPKLVNVTPPPQEIHHFYNEYSCSKPSINVPLNPLTSPGTTELRWATVPPTGANQPRLGYSPL